jgi:hypothetical protein
MTITALSHLGGGNTEVTRRHAHEGFQLEEYKPVPEGRLEGPHPITGSNAFLMLHDAPHGKGHKSALCKMRLQDLCVDIQFVVLTAQEHLYSQRKRRDEFLKLCAPHTHFHFQRVYQHLHNNEISEKYLESVCEGAGVGIRDFEKLSWNQWGMALPPTL